MPTQRRLAQRRQSLASSAVLGIGLLLGMACSSHTPLARPAALDNAAALAPPAPMQSFFQQLGWENFLNWEYTDNQRFHTDGEYGPIAHIAPSDDIASYTTSTFSAAGAPGLLVGGVFVDTTAPTPIVLPDSYTELQLSAGRNCIFLSNASGWYAYLTPASSGANPCPTPAAPPATRLKVYAVNSPANLGSGDHVPPTARFHEGTRNARNLPFMGLKCGSQWCMLLPQTADSMNLPHHDVFPGRKKWAVHGWHDAQHLMMLDASNKPRLSPHVASVIPDSSLDGFTIGTNFSSGYVHVATVHFKAKPKGDYETKWGFKKGFNEVFLKYDTTSPTGWIGQVRNYLKLGDFVLYTWTYDMEVDRHPHATNPGSLNPPGAARFLWDDRLDEGLWVRCDAGCCKVAPQ